MLLSGILQRKRALWGACFALVLAGGVMSGSVAQSASFACQMPVTEATSALCVAVEVALGASLGAPVVRADTGADYTLRVQSTKPTSLVARLDTVAQQGPLLGVTISDAQRFPARIIAKFAGELVESLK